MNAKRANRSGRGFDYGRSLLYTIYRHASGMSEPEAALKAQEASSHLLKSPDVGEGRVLSLPA
ncbi:MAG: hypothetical protein ACOY4F_06060 [Thermodesulfobacteriota bacterium]